MVSMPLLDMATWVTENHNYQLVGELFRQAYFTWLHTWNIVLVLYKWCMIIILNRNTRHL